MLRTRPQDRSAADPFREADAVNLKQIETFVWVATLGGVRKAAERLHCSQPAISSRIAALEADLGVRLFEREAGRFGVTAKGMELLPLAKKLMLLSQQFRAQASGAAAASGICRVGASETIVQTWLPDFLRLAALALPRIDIQLTIDVSSIMRDALIARSLDLAFLMGPVSDFRIENRPLCTYALAWVCSPALNLPEGPVAVETLTAWPIVTFSRSTRPFAEVEALSRRDTINAVRLIPIASLAAGVRIVEDGIGVGALPAAVVAQSVAAGRLRVIEADWTPSALVFTASFPRDPYDPKTEQILAVAQEAAGRVER